MLVSKKAHEALLQAKDAQIAALKDEIGFLRHLVQPRRSSTPTQIEADAILGGAQDQLHQDEKLVAINSEAARILSGNY